MPQRYYATEIPIDTDLQKIFLVIAIDEEGNEVVGVDLDKVVRKATEVFVNTKIISVGGIN